ncbi:hypothetical protein BFX18_17685 [Vibrio cholerae]|uniref:hypothetical protein n=2 Tax=Vibrio cholerae TaxID=666 RepID=UPI000851E0F1|nr:hypothetical protein [Vibrio cholerae]MDV2394623.1 hypothetical protein [Vibrio cholerae]OEJ11088.1 hypothetical protein BFX26_17950 [Vibrio cholerae]OFI81971.1 hypothetical protein BFX18_17685 [Vibrio cholerae]
MWDSIFGGSQEPPKPDINNSNVLTVITDLVDEYTLDFTSKLLSQFLFVIGPIITLFLLIMLIKAAVDQRDIKEPLLTMIRFCFLYALVTSNYHFHWILVPLVSVKHELMVFFVGGEAGIWQATVQAIDEGKKIITSNSGWFGDMAATIFGFGLMLAYGFCYAVYSAICLINKFIFNLAVMFSGILLLLSAKTIFVGLIKAWFQLLIASILNVILVTIVMVISIKASKSFLVSVSASNGGAEYFAAFLIPLITIYLMPNVGNFTNSIVGGNGSDFRQELSNSLGVAKKLMGR